MKVRRQLSRSVIFLALLIGLTGTTMSAASAHTATDPAEVSVSGWTPRLVGPGRDACPTYYVCVWTGTSFTGSGIGFTGTIGYGDGVDWRGTVWENNVHSAVNKTTIPVDFFDYRAGGARPSLGKLYPGHDFRSGWSGANYADGLIYR